MALEDVVKPHRELKSPEPTPPSHAHGSKPRVMQSAEVTAQGQIQQVRDFRGRLAKGGVEPDDDGPAINYVTLWSRGYDVLEAITSLNELVDQAFEDGFEPQGGISSQILELGSPEAVQLDGVVHLFQAVRRTHLEYAIRVDDVEEENDNSSEI